MVGGTPDLGQTYDVECPHCHKSFVAEPMSGGAARYSGFKCSHCRLFVPFDRVADQIQTHATPDGNEN